MADFSENIFKAIDILTKKQIEAVKFDETISAVITDASRAEKGEYVVSTGGTKFTAYSSETGYKVNDAVMVTIPQGNYDNQKIIVGKQVDTNSNSALIFRSPFINFIDATKNIATPEMASTAGGRTHYFLPNGVTANDPNSGSWPTNVLNFYNAQNKVLLWASKENLGYQNFSRLGIKADFQTYLHEYETICGNYGLAVEVTFTTNELTENNSFVNVFNFDSDTYFGDIYNFSVSFSQEQIFDISEFNEFSIKQIKVYLYQRENFYDMYNKAVPYEYDVAGSPVTLAHNIIVNNLYVSLGIDTVEFINDTATLLTNNSLRYHKALIEDEDILDRNNANLKEVELRWIHKDEEAGYISTIEQNKIPADYEIRWYRYRLGAPSPDALAGAHWDRYYGFKSTVDESSGEWALTAADLAAGAADIATNSLNIQFKPNVNLASEKLKAIVLKHETTGIENFERKIATSQELEFINDTEIQSKATVIDENTLSIRFNDDEKGNYFLYNRAGLIGKDEDGELRTLTAVFDPDEHDVYQKAPLVDAYSIKWIFPAEPTMIQPAATGASVDSENSNRPLVPSAEHVFSNLSYIDAGSPEGYTQDNEEHTGTWHQLEDPYSVGFFIKKKLNRNATNNTIRLEVIKDGQEFTAQVQLLFGTAGSSGSDYTIVLTWDNGQNAFDISKNYLTGQLTLMDQSGLPITNPEGEWKCEWYKVAEADPVPTQTLLFETRDIKYPVVEASSRVEVENIELNTPDPRTTVVYWAETEGEDKYEYNPVTNKFEAAEEDTTYPFLYATVGENEQEEKAYQTKLEFFPVNTIIPNPNPNPEDPDECLIPGPEIEPTWNESEPIAPIKPTTADYGAQPAHMNSSDGLAWIRHKNELDAAYQESFEAYQAAFSDYQTRYANYQLEHAAWATREAERALLVRDGQIYNNNVGNLILESENGVTASTYYYSYNKRLFIKQDNMYILDPWGSYSEVETYYYPQYTTERELAFQHLRINYGCDALGETEIILDGNSEATDVSNKVVVEAQGDSETRENLLKSLYLIKVTLNDFGDYPLEAFFPLPLKNRITEDENLVVDYIEGPTDIRYSTTGETDFDKNPYQISTRSWDDIQGWQVNRHGYHDTTELSGYWEFLIHEETDSNFLPELIETGEVISDEQFDIPKLDPPSVYFKETPICGVVFYKQVGGEPDSENDIILWTQPLLMYQDNYPSTTLNKWTGKDILTDQETGTVVANGLAAGKKEKDNTFTGVVIGDWSRTDTDPFVTAQTGVYGFNHGAMSYALKDDGTAFFGKDGHGRIYLNGNKAQIYSALWKENEQGMLLDIDDGYLKINGEIENGTRASVYISPDGTSSSKPYFLITDNLNKDLIRIQNNKYYLQTSDFSTANQTGTKIDLKDGKITSYNFTINAVKNGQGIQINSNGLPFLNIQESGKSLLYIRGKIGQNLSGEYYLQSLDYEKERTVTENGNQLTVLGKGTKIDLAQGKIRSYNFSIDATSYNGKILIDSGASLYPLSIVGSSGSAQTIAEQHQVIFVYNNINYPLYQTQNTDPGYYLIQYPLNSGPWYIVSFSGQLTETTEQVDSETEIEGQLSDRSSSISGPVICKINNVDYNLYQYEDTYLINYHNTWYTITDIEGYIDEGEISASLGSEFVFPELEEGEEQRDPVQVLYYYSDASEIEIVPVYYNEYSEAINLLNGDRSVKISWDGTLYANKAQISGSIYGSSINGSNITGGTINGAKIIGTVIQGGSITGGVISGGYITGTINAGGGTISGGTITGGSISGARISGGSISGAGGQFQVDSGRIYLNGWNFLKSIAGNTSGTWACRGLIIGAGGATINGYKVIAANNFNSNYITSDSGGYYVRAVYLGTRITAYGTGLAVSGTTLYCTVTNTNTWRPVSTALYVDSQGYVSTVASGNTYIGYTCKYS